MVKAEKIGDSTADWTESQQEPKAGPRLRLVVGACRGSWLDISEKNYFELVSWTARLPNREVATAEVNIEESAMTETLAAIGCNLAEWQEQLAAIRLGTRVVGGCAKVRAWAEKHGQRWIRRAGDEVHNGRRSTQVGHCWKPSTIV